MTSIAISKLTDESAYKMLKSKEDDSVNFVYPDGTEARFVYRPGSDYFIIYLSSHLGCNQACRFCHLTQTGQTDMRPVYLKQFFEQFHDVLDYYFSLRINNLIPKLKKVHLNWMARGEVLLNPHMSTWWKHYSEEVKSTCALEGIDQVEFNFSTIMPKGNLLKQYQELVNPPTIYYSLYSLNPIFRKRWIPKALQPEVAFHQLKEYQVITGKEIVLHWAFIDSQNDSIEDVLDICILVEESGINFRLNVVRYNPFSELQGKESPEAVIGSNFRQLVEFMKVPGSRIVPRVGRDVYASCGTFFNKD